MDARRLAGHRSRLGVRREFAGKGYAREAATAAIDWAFDTLGWTEVIHSIQLPNTASIALAERLGSSYRGPSACRRHSRTSKSVSGRRAASNGRRASAARGNGVITVHGFSASGNCYKVRLLLEQLGRDYRWVEVDSAHGQTRTPEFLAKNPNGKVPMLEPTTAASWSNRTRSCAGWPKARRYLPADRWQRAQVLSGCSSSSTATSPTSRWRASSAAGLPAGLAAPRRAAALRERGHQALAVMERHLADAPWFPRRAATASPTSRCMPTPTSRRDGGIDLAPIRRSATGWRACEATPGFVPMPAGAERA